MIRVLEAIVEDAGGNGEILIRSPGVGMVSATPRTGEVLVAGSKVGRLSALGRSVELVLPKGISGRVAERALHNRRDPVRLRRRPPASRAGRGGRSRSGLPRPVPSRHPGSTGRNLRDRLSYARHVLSSPATRIACLRGGRPASGRRKHLGLGGSDEVFFRHHLRRRRTSTTSRGRRDPCRRQFRGPGRSGPHRGTARIRNIS